MKIGKAKLLVPYTVAMDFPSHEFEERFLMQGFLNRGFFD